MSGLPALYLPKDFKFFSTSTGAPAVFAVASGIDHHYSITRAKPAVDKLPHIDQRPEPTIAAGGDGKFLAADGTWRTEPEKPDPIPEPQGPSRAQLRRERATAELRLAMDKPIK